MPADQVLENHNAGESVEDIAYNFDLKPDDIRFVLIYAALSANRRKAGVSERGSRVLDGCAVIAPAYMGRKRIFQMLSLQPATILVLGRGPSARVAVAFEEAAPHKR